MTLDMANCPDCGSVNVTEVMGTANVPEGFPVPEVVLEVAVPVIACGDCGREWFGPRAIDLMDDAVVAYRKSKPGA